MNDNWYRRLAWGTTILALSLLGISAVMLFLAPDHSGGNWLENQVKAVVTLGAPILGLIILAKQPRQRIGWLWIIYGMVVGLRTLGHAIYYFGGSQPAGYSALEYFLLWATEVGTIAGFVCMILLLLWFPDGQLLSRWWRLLYIWLFLAITGASKFMLEAGSNWNGGADAGGIVIENPYGWFPASTSIFLPFTFFLSIILIMILAVVSLLFRYRSAGKLVRLQLRWFVLGGLLFVGLNFIPVFFIDETQIDARLSLFLEVLGHSAIIPLYAAVGVAILRYHLYDFDVIIRKTLLYAILTGFLALVYFGMVILLQTLVGQTIDEQSPFIIVLSTLLIAALFAPLRRRIQAFIDRRFYRKKYDAQQVLAQFAQTARDETDMEVLTAELVRVVQETIQPEQVSIWLKGRR